MEESAKLFEINELIRFYGQLIGTPGLSETNNNIANEYLETLLKATKSGIVRLTTGIITK